LTRVGLTPGRFDPTIVPPPELAFRREDCGGFCGRGGQFPCDRFGERRGGWLMQTPGPSRRAVLRTVVTLTAANHRAAQAAPANTYIVGSTATGVPFSFIDVKTNTLVGAMIDIVRVIAADSDFRIDLRVTAFGALIPSLMTKKIDIISAAMLKTPARAKVVDFSDPVYAYGAGIVVPARSGKAFKSVADLRGMAVGAEVGTRFVEQLKAAGVEEVKTYDNLMEMLGDLSVGRIGAAYGDAPIFNYQLTQARIKNARLAVEFQPPSVEDVCLVARKGDSELLGRIDASIRRLKSTTIRSILDHWGLR
jgi:polar amino acid transport system substrate-binding protein